MPRFLIILTLFCGIVFGLPACTTNSDSDPSEEELAAATLQAEIDEAAEQEVLAALWEDEVRFNQVLDSIETGIPPGSRLPGNSVRSRMRASQRR